MLFLSLFGVLAVIFGCTLTLLSYAAPDIRIDGRAVVLNVVWSVILAGLATALARGVWALLAG